MKIFVSLAAFCDPFLRFTINGLFEKADHPDRVHVAVIDQSLDDHRSWLETFPHSSNIRYAKIDPIDSRGVSWARNIAFSLYDGEDFLLQIDSHTHFDPGWDTRLITLMTSMLAHADKPIISTYPPGFYFDDQGIPQRKGAPSPLIMILRPHPDTSLSENNATLRFRAHFVAGNQAIEGGHVAAGFLFTLGQFVDEIPYDPFLYFHGEEQSLAIRAFTRGWTIFHPRHSDIPLMHLYKQAGEEHRSHHWHPDYERKRLTKWVELKKRSDARLRRLLLEQTLQGAYGLGDVRTLEEFAQVSGVDYRNRTLRLEP